MNWDEVDRLIAQQCKLIPFKKVLDAFNAKGVLPIQHIIYIDIFKRGDFKSVPPHLQIDFMKYIVRKIKKYMFNGYLPHQNKEFTEYLFQKFGSDNPDVQLFAYGFKYWTFEHLLDFNNFIKWIAWILSVYDDRERMQKLHIYSVNYNMMRIMSGMSGLQFS